MQRPSKKKGGVKHKRWTVPDKPAFGPVIIGVGGGGGGGKLSPPSPIVTNHVHSDLGRAIIQFSKAARELLTSNDAATRKAILLLIAHTCNVKQKDVKKVLHAASELQRKYVP